MAVSLFGAVINLLLVTSFTSQTMFLAQICYCCNTFELRKGLSRRQDRDILSVAIVLSKL